MFVPEEIKAIPNCGYGIDYQKYADAIRQPDRHEDCPAKMCLYHKAVHGPEVECDGMTNEEAGLELQAQVDAAQASRINQVLNASRLFGFSR